MAIPQMSFGLADKETQINELFKMLWPGMAGARDPQLSVGLTFAIVTAGGITGASFTLTASTTSYIELDIATGVVSKNETAFTSGRAPLYEVTTGATSVSNWTDKRDFIRTKVLRDTLGAAGGANSVFYQLLDQGNISTTLQNALRYLDGAQVHWVLDAAGTNAPPGTNPPKGTAAIVGAAPSGAWVLLAPKTLMVYGNDGWQQAEPRRGQYVLDGANPPDLYAWDGTTWLAAGGTVNNLPDKQGKVLDDLIEIADYEAEIDGLTTPGGYIVKVDSVNFLLSGATILVAETSGAVSQTLMAPVLSKIGTRYKDGASWTEWVYCLAPNDVVNWHHSTTAGAADAVINADGTFSREVSTEEWKRDIEPMEDRYADAIVQGAAPIYYRSKCERDPQDWSYWGIPAEQLATVDPRFVRWGHSTKEVPQPFGPPKTVIDYDSPLKPIGVMYSRLVVPLLQVVKRQGAAIAALEARLAFLEMLHSP